MSIRWITPRLGTAPASEILGLEGVVLLDVRDLVDKPGNPTAEIVDKIRQGVEILAAGATLVVGCDYGISRSNAVAAGILAVAEGSDLNAALRKVREATGEAGIKIELVAAVRLALAQGIVRAEEPSRSQILVTGAAGFLGTELCRVLRGTMDLFPCTRLDADLEKSAVDLELLVDEHGTRCMVHLASPRVYTSNAAMGKTLSMLRNAIDVCCSRDIHLVFLSSWEVYSGYRGDLLVDESVPFLPKGPYGETKVLCENLIRLSRATRGLRCTVLRPSPVYGLASDRPRFIRTYLEKALDSLAISTHRYRNGDPGLDLLAVDDLVRAIASTTTLVGGEDLNLGTGETVTTSRIAEWIVSWTDSRSMVESRSIDDYTARIALDASAAGRKLGWTPTRSAQEGLEIMIREILEQRRGGRS